MKRATLMLAAVVLFSLSSYRTSNASYRHPNYWYPVAPWWQPVPSLKQALLERRENVKAAAAGIQYRRVPYTRWCAYTNCYW